MGTTPPTLNYAVPKPHARLKKWTRRILLAVFVLACLYATPIVWLYVGWKQEQPAQQMVERVGGRAVLCESADPAFLYHVIPDRLNWVQKRVGQVSLADTPVTDNDLGTLGALRRLNMLIVNRTPVTDAGLVHLKGLTGLQRLSLYRTQVTDAGLVHFKGFTELQGLDLYDTRVTDAGLIHLKGLAGLRTLFLGRTRVTDAGVADLQKALPQCKIMR